MQAVFRCVTLCVILAIAVCFDSEESNESIEDLVLNGFRANAFINRHRPYIYGFRRGFKTQAEQRSEICETSYGCKMLARRYGPELAYNKYFTSRQSNNNYRYRF